MGSIVIGIQRDTNGKALAARLFDGPVFYPNGQDPRTLSLPEPMPTCDTGPNVKAYGLAVYEALSGHPEIALEIQRLLISPAAVADGLQFRIETPMGEDVRWETLCSAAHQFLAVEPGCRITRLASTVANPDVGNRSYLLPLRLFAVLAAFGVDATNELTALRSQIDAARTAGLQIEATIYLGQEALLSQMKALSAAGYDFRPMPTSADALKAEIKSQQVQFLHLFGHGSVRGGVPALEFGTITDELTGTSGSVILAIDQLVIALEVQKTTWMTVLNSCSGAKALPQLNSMAFKIAQRGSPYAVGMNEPIEAADATRFTGILYRELFDIVTTALAGGGTGSVEMDFSGAIVPVRRHFYETYQLQPPNAFGRWSLPVLYQNLSPLKVNRLATPAASFIDDIKTKARIDTIVGALHNLPPETADEVRARFLALLKNDPPVPEELWPDKFGNFERAAPIVHPPVVHA